MIDIRALFNIVVSLTCTACHYSAKRLLNILLFVFGIFYFNATHAQGGGPPMLTDDPATLQKKQWEINTSINTQITEEETQLSVPYIDANYGLTNRLQLKVEFPYLITIDKQHHSFGQFQHPLFGVKYHFLDEDKYFVSVSTYPQAIVTGTQKLFLAPLLVCKTIGKFVIGEEIGYMIVQGNSNNILNGNLLSYKISNKWEVMAEYFLQKEMSSVKGVQGFMNYGWRYTINKTFTFIGSLGTQTNTPMNEQRQYFFSFIGVQSDF